MKNNSHKIRVTIYNAVGSSTKMNRTIGQVKVACLRACVCMMFEMSDIGDIISDFNKCKVYYIY